MILWLVIANRALKTISGLSSAFIIWSDNNCLRQLIVDVVSAVLDGNCTAVLPPCDNGDRFTAVTAQRKQKCIQLFIISFDPLNNVLFAFLCMRQIHMYHLIQILFAD